MKKYLLTLLIAAGSIGGNFSDLSALTIRITCRSKGREIELCKKAIKEWEKKHGNKHKVEIVTLPHASNECFALYQQWFSAETFDVDIMQMDVAWIGVFSDYLLPLDELGSSGNKSEKKEEFCDTSDYFDAVRENMFDKNGHLVALPWYTDCGVMYYRKDLLQKYGMKVPETWDELYETAAHIQNEERKDPEKKNRFYGFIFQAKAFEVLTCNFAEFVDSFGGSIVHDGKSTVNSKAVVDATMFMVKCLKNITNHNILNYSEEDSRGIFQSGNAVFMRNWPYAWALMNEPSTAVAGKIGIMPIPRGKAEKDGGKQSGTLGGWYLVVSKFSKHPKEAADLAKFLTSKAQQKERARHSYLPAFKSLYDDPEILKQNPSFGTLRTSLEHAVVRPSIDFGKSYPRASSNIYNAINTILSYFENMDQNEAIKLLTRLNKRMNRLLKKSYKRNNRNNEKN